MTEHDPRIPAEDAHKLDAAEHIGSNPSAEPSIGEIIARRFSRRDAMRGLLGAGMAAALPAAAAAAAQGSGPSSFAFRELRHVYDATHHVPEGYDAQVLIRWGDPVVAGAPGIDMNAITPAAQEGAFGYNCDYIDFKPLPRGSKSGTHGLLVVNHEYTNTNLLFAGLGSGRDAALRSNRTQVEVEMAAHGLSVVEIRRDGAAWQVVRDSRLNRRITASTPMTVSGPAAGHELLKTGADPSGRAVLGTINNCAGGNTPWGTVLTAEENFNLYFGGDTSKAPLAEMYRRYGVGPRTAYAWSKFVDRFDVAKEPNEPHRFGWVVEFDPYDPASTPVKRTALGRFKHEGCHHGIAADGRVVIYMGDDERFDYVYKFVTARPWDPNDRAANRDLLDEGTLYVARFSDDGKVAWMPLVHGQGPLTEANGFRSQADVVIFARKAADLLKATPMDRPEDVEPNPVTGRVYVLLTNNTRRRAEQVDRANPRANNAHGHIVEITNPNGDHAALEGTWTIFLAAGKPGMDAGAIYHRAVSNDGWLSCPDNVAFDSKGRMYIATDGAPGAAGVADGVYAADTTGTGRALTKLFFQAPIGAEVCGPLIAPDDQTMFLAIQHPGETSGSTFEKPSTRWPDFADGVPPRPSVVVVTKKGGGAIGS
jgi:secreted PhoX family phosphatase